MQDFPANSQKAKARSDGPQPGDRPEKIERITSADVKRRRKGLGRKFKETFIEGNARDAFEYMITDVAVPNIRDLASEATHAVIDRLIYGETRPRRGSPPGGYTNVGRVNYQSMSQPTQSRAPSTRMLSQQARARGNFDEIIIQSRQEATDVIDRMFDVLARYGSVPVGTLYELTGIQSSHTDFKWGWTDLRGARATGNSSRGYLLILPEPEPLD